MKIHEYQGKKILGDFNVPVQDGYIIENLDDVEKIIRQVQEDFNTEDLIDEAEDTMTILSKYVNSLEIENKKELDSLMKSLYTESLTMETV